MKERDDQPDYIKIYSDIINKKYPEKYETCKDLLSKSQLDTLEVITLNDKIFGVKEKFSVVTRTHRAYDTSTIVKILDYQKKYHLTNTQLANHFALSRNTVAKWKKLCFSSSV